MNSRLLIKSAVSALLIAAAAAANAQFTPAVGIGTQTPAGGAAGTLTLEIYDPITNQSITETLGMTIGASTATGTNVNIPSMVTTSAAGLTINFGQIANSGGTNYFAQTFGSDTNTLDYAVYAAGAPVSSHSGAQQVLFSTLLNPGDPATIAGALTAGSQNLALNAANSWFTGGTGLPGSHQVATGLWIANEGPYPGSTCGGTCAYFGGQGTQFGGNYPAGTSNAGAVNTPLNFYQVSIAGNGAAGSAAVSAFNNSNFPSDTRQGYFELVTSGTGANETASLEYIFPSQGSPVPLPAAAWLLLSGLFGVGVFGRRRAAAV